MIPDETQNKELDDRLKAAFADDLPDTVAAGMRRRIAAFRAGTTEEETRPTISFWPVRKGLWAALAVGMLVAGFLLQGLQIRNPLADRIALIKTEFANPESSRPADLNSTRGNSFSESYPAHRSGDKEV